MPALDPSKFAPLGKLPVPDVAQALGIHPSTVLNWLYKKTVLGERAGKFWVVDCADLERLIRERNGPAIAADLIARVHERLAAAMPANDEAAS